MRSLLTWFNARRRLVALSLLGLIAVVVFSAGSTPIENEWIRIPDLGFLLAIALGVLALLGVFLIGFAKPKASERKPSEMRSMQAAVFVAVLAVVALQLFGPSGTAEEPSVVEQEQPIPPEPIGTSTESGAPVSPTDIAALVLIVLLIVLVLTRSLRTSLVTSPDPATEDDRLVPEELMAAVEEAHHHLIAEPDPRAAVLLAYASLENALADRGLARLLPETPSEHVARVLTDLPSLVGPAVQLGKLYEIARFSNETISGDQRQQATQALDRARGSLAVPQRDTS